MLNFDEIKNDTSKIYRILKEKNCFQETDFNERYLPQLHRNMLQFKNISTKLFIAKTKSKEFLNWYDQNIPKFQYDAYDFRLEIITLLCHHGLSTFELLKRFLLNTLNLSEINKKSNLSISKTSMLGDVVKAIKKIVFIKPKRIDELIDNEFRKTLAHDSWYLEDNYFKFRNTNGVDKQLSLNDVYFNVVKIWFVNKIISMRYTEDFYPESIELYDNNLGKIMDEVMPLYPDNP
jgi:hypothetical protein